ncbi:MAG: hypothetical protein DRQ55_10000 [Planctomycetota bacterium]|nr:MAG: hypothetical protein DRQ55_10000 [Planctomycetota bacterium]
MGLTDRWSIVAVSVAALFVLAVGLVAHRIIRGRGAPVSPEERAELAQLAMTPLQKRAWTGLLVGLAMILACVAVVANAGTKTYSADGDLRLLVVGFVFVAMLAWQRVLSLSRSTSGAVLDERDRRVLLFAPHVQTAAVLITVSFWCVALTESFRGEGIPTDYMYLLFWSVFLTLTVSFSAGILIGYRWIGTHGEG